MEDLFCEATDTNWCLRLLEACFQAREERNKAISGDVLHSQVPGSGLLSLPAS